jgi:hypothetical protein
LPIVPICIFSMGPDRAPSPARNDKSSNCILVRAAKVISRNRVGWWVISALAALLADGCGSSSQSSPPLQIAVRTVEDTAVLQRTAEETAFTVTAIVRNDDTRLAQVALCGMQAQRDINSVWTTVFTPWCSSSALRSLASGDSIIVPVDVFGYTLPNRIPALDPRMVPGRYRLLFGVGLGDPGAPTGSSGGQVQPSTPFTVK